MANDIVYERDYREVHKIMSARTFTEEGGSISIGSPKWGLQIHRGAYS